MTKESRKAGDFTGLATDYSNSRPDYCPSVLKALAGLLDRDIKSVDFADVGAGTGIWTRMVYNLGVKSVYAIEPNLDMRDCGQKINNDLEISWREGNGENTGLPEQSIDWISMASSFHWTDFESSCKEFHRVLRDGGRFTALWNPRLIHVNPLLVEIESYLEDLKPNIKRVSSGLSGITTNLTEDLESSGYFEDVVYLEGRHVIEMSKDRYLCAWKSVNDLQVQLGSMKFRLFLDYVREKIEEHNVIETTYLTRAWSAKRKSL